MNSFLYQLTQELYTRYGRKLSECWIIFPNRRAGLFFSKYLNQLIKAPFWAPRIITINELMQEFSSLVVEDNLGLLFRLFHKYNQKRGADSQETFDEFYHWGEMLLSDFDDIDKYRVNAQQLFENLADIKEVEGLFEYLDKEQIEAIRSFWNSFNPRRISGHQKDFISVWATLHEIYSELRKELLSQGLAYEGMVYRQVAEKLEQGKINIEAYQLIFIGFNALNRCEKDLFTYLKQNQKAEFYWDYDEYYLNKPYHEAGLFLRENIKQFAPPSTQITFSNFEQKSNPVEFIALSSEVGQAKHTYKIIREFFNENVIEPENTAVVLADEELLLPVLHSIPENIKAINVTMGCPVKNTPVAALLRLIIELQKGRRKRRDGYYFYYKHVLALLNHQYINAIEPAKINKLKNTILKTNRIYLKPDDFLEIPVVGKIFSQIETVRSFSGYLLELLQQIFTHFHNREKETNTTDRLEQEYIYHLFLMVKRLKTLLEEHQIDLQYSTYYRLLDKLVNSLTIPFEGEPLAGLQIMGILETRLLDFKRVVVLSMNEGKFPKTGTPNSFIPYNLRKGFGMPVVDHQDAIFAYYFYRLIQRAGDVKLLYSTKSDGIRTGEMSRFMYQLQYESGITINEYNPSFDISLTEQKSITIRKNDRIMATLNQYCGQGKLSLSPSAINTYLDCKLRFYFKYMAKLKEPDEITEEIDPLTFGNIFHRTVEQLYSPYKGQVITDGILDNIIVNKGLIDKCLTQSFQTEYFCVEASQPVEISGRNVLIYDILKKYIYQLVKTDKHFVPFEILELERSLQASIPVNSNGQNYNVNISGSVDRVDRVGETIRIIDYKTGRVSMQFKNIASLFEEEGKNRNGAVLQTLLYCLFYNSNYSPESFISPAIYSLKEMFNKPFRCSLGQKHGRDSEIEIKDYRFLKNEFESELKNLLENIFHPEVPFTQTEDTNTCNNCPYIEICHRGT